MVELLREHISRSPCGHWRNEYRCACGNIFITSKYNVKNGHTQSCGCHRNKRAKEANTTHGLEHTKEYMTWLNIKQRCYNPKNNRFTDYGGRGITVSKRWLQSFENFYTDMGARPEGASIDRINNDKGYSKSNCRWATKSEQMKNRRPRSQWNFKKDK